MSKNLRTAHLSWLRTPIQQGVEVAKVSLDTYHQKLIDLASPPSDAQGPWFDKHVGIKNEAFSTLTREVTLIHSSLSVVGCIGGAALALELKIILNKIRLDELEEPKVVPALLSVLNGLLMIPGYIKMVVNGAPDSAGILSKPINELREIRGVPILEEDNILPADIEFVFIDPPLKDRDTTQSHRNEVFSRSPKRFREAFSTYISNHSKPALAEMKATLRELHVVTNDPEVGCFWWIGECLADALHSGAIRSAGNTLSQLRMLSVAIQRADSDGEDGAKQTLGVARFKTLLSALSMSTKLSSETEEALAVFNVGKTVDFGSLTLLQSRIENSQATKLADIVDELKPLLETAMVSLGRARASKNQSAFDTHIETYRTAVRHVTSVFYMVNENELAAIATKALSRVENVKTSVGLNDPDTLDGLKSDILYLDDRLGGVDTNEAIRALNVSGIKPDILATIVSEGLTCLAQTRKLITQHVDGGSGSEDLQAGLQALQQASTAMAFVGAEQISTLMNGACQAFLGLLEEGGIKSSPRLSTAARSMVAVEIYLSTIVENLEPSPDLLVKAERALADLDIHIEYVETVSTNQLIQKFEDGMQQLESINEEENPFLSELLDIRGDLERCMSHPEVRNRVSMQTLFKPADRLAIASKMYGFDSFARIARALATYSDKVADLSTKDGFDFAEAQDLLKKGIEMCLRCMDEYAARGKVALFTKDLETTLLEKAEPALVVNSAFPADREAADSADDPKASTAILEGELVSEHPIRPIPDDYDATHIAIFREEAETYYSVLREFCASTSKIVTRDVCRAAHSIHGIAGSVGCSVLHDVFGTIEARLEIILAKGQPMDLADVDQLSLLLNETHEFELNFPWEVETPLLNNWREMASMLGEGYEEVEYEELPAPADKVDAVAGVEASAPDSEEKIPHAEFFPVDSVREYSDDMAEFYIDEADDVLPELQVNVNAWLGDMSDTELVATIKRQMHTLKGAALMAQATAIGAITHSMESLFESIALNIIAPDQRCADLVRLVLNTIIDMTSIMRQGIAYESPTALIQCLQHAVDCNEIDLSYIYNSQQIDKPSTIPPQPDSVPKDVKAEAERTAEPGEQRMEDPITPQPTAVARKRARGGRGKGGARRHGDNAVPTQLAVAAALHATESTDEESDAPIGPVVEQSPVLADQAAAAPAEKTALSVPPIENIPHAETFDVEEAHVQKNDAEFLRHSERDFDREYPIDGIDSPVSQKPVKSRAVLDMLNRTAAIPALDRRKRSGGTTEKMKVDLKLLENASESASELTAVRHRLDALNEDQILGITAIREMLEINSLQHGQFTTALRGYFNQQPSARANVDDTHLERFTDLSAMQVSLGAQIDEILASVVEVLGYSLQKRNALRDQGMLISGLQRDLLDSRLVPFLNVKPKLTMAIDRACNDTKKTVTTTYIGSDVIMDKMIQDNISEPLTHILRNAIDHGIESKSEREAAGKPAAGNIEITVYRKAKNVVITIKDDGRGIDISAVRKKAIEKRIISEQDELTDKEIMRLITSSGFSTAKVVTSVSGRGVGMDIVAAAVDNLGGQLFIDSTQGKGTIFTVELPFTIGSNRAMMCSAGTQWFAIPSYFMCQVIMTDAAELNRQREQHGRATVDFDGATFEVVNLADLIAMPDLRTSSDRQRDTTLILCEQGEIRFAIEVEKVESMPEIHIRKIEGILSQVRGIVGETEMQDGTPVFVLDVMELARLNLKTGPNGYQVRQNRVRSIKRDQKPIALVVDDSLQYRTFLERHFTERGYMVVTARDGVDGLHQLPLERIPDLIMVDLEMPRMDGFGFTSAIRQLSDYNKVPIIMITSRTHLEEKAYALGVDLYLNKPCNHSELEQAVAKVKSEKIGAEVFA